MKVEKGYEPLAQVLQEALDQAQSGKGKRCHANGLPFLEQPIMTGGRECGPGGLAFQARKKILEALNCKDDERAIADLLGAINYTAAMVILRREKASISAGRISIEDAEDLLDTGRVKFCYRDCEFLEPTEAEQDRQNVKGKHHCRRYNRPVVHDRYHPDLVRLPFCDHLVIPNDREWAPVIKTGGVIPPVDDSY